MLCVVDQMKAHLATHWTGHVSASECGSKGRRLSERYEAPALSPVGQMLFSW